jgi:phosphonoacetaldehyde hydrolase
MMNVRARFDLVIFDWAGTMVDFGCQAPVLALIEAFGREAVQLDVAAARRDMGMCKADHVRAILAQPDVASQWLATHGRAPGDHDVISLMDTLGPLMREHAGKAATLIPGARETFESLSRLGLRVASSTGYTREMMQPVLLSAAQQGYSPEHVVCAGETPAGRPAPLMIYKACVDLGVWPLSRVVKVDDAEAGVAEGRAAGAFTVGIASGNLVGLPLDVFQALPRAAQAQRLQSAGEKLLLKGADIVIESVADLVPALQRVAARGSTPR